MKTRLIIISLVVLMLMTACGPVTISLGNKELRGSGTIVTEERQVSNFDVVSFSGIGELTITQGDSEKLTVTTDDNILPNIETIVQGGVLQIRIKSITGGLNTTDGIKYNLQVKNLNRLEVSGVGEVKAADLKNAGGFSLNVSGVGSVTIDRLDAARLDANLSGVGGVTVSGSAPDLSVNLSGVGSYNGGDLQSARADVNLSSAGSATVWVTDRLHANLSGVGSISYYGSPEVTSKVSGLGSVKNTGSK